MKSSPVVGLIHGIITLAVGVGISVFSGRLDRIVVAASYVVGADVLWRMTETPLPWEFSKYAATVILGFGLVRMRAYRIPRPALLYFLLLVPAVIPTWQLFNRETAIGRYSMWLSGPLALSVALCFFENCALSAKEIHRALLALCAPIVSIATIATYGTFTENIVFGTQSLHAASGGFGPNQVSGSLGVGALLLGLYLIRQPMELGRRLILGCLIVAFLGQAALTLSRTGIYTAVLAFIGPMFLLAGDARTMRRVVVGVVVFAAIGAVVVYPFLDSYSGGALSARYEEKGMTGREDLMMIDLEIWLDNPVYGVGVGISQFHHPIQDGQYIISHNELMRMLAEHGTLGLIALLLLFGLVASRILAPNTNADRALVLAVATWSVLFLFANGMRIAPAPYLLAMATTRFRGESL
jgi:O-antigen ligase